MHYGSICLRKDLSVFILCTLWDDVAGKLMLYDSTMIESLDVRKMSMWMITHMKLREFAIDKILANDRVMEMVEGTEKNAQRLINGDLRKLGVRARLTGAVRYDQWGSIAQVAQLISQHNLIINDTCIEPLTQFCGWTIDNGRPGQENTGWCEGLCLIVSDLKRRSAFRPRPVARDYMDQKKLQEILAADPMRR
jgi:hypothetical protein